ncbi:hypothetical protein F5Y16DRAFT_382532 [Xylariaceae sp. FL0255]|nr:hypothetical protein F5Y16DRAFT_382532 [Xylariaceae sp. FL0255]
MPEGRQSPAPETQSGKQLHDPPASGQGVEKAEHKEETNTDQLKNLSSNPAGPLDEHAKESTKK